MNNLKTCLACVMDDTDLDISYIDGICNHCKEFDELKTKYYFSDSEEETNLRNIKNEVVKRSKNNEFDVLIGMSGGVDSSYVCHLVNELGLKALCLHFDNGWNSDISVSNIKKIVQKCNFELITVVMDWSEFRDIQRSFFKAGVVDIELITDNAIYALAWKEARKYGIRSWITGSNYLYEHGMPKGWSWPKQDSKNIRDIHKLFGSTEKIKKLPLYSPHKYAMIRAFNFGFIKQFKILDSINYDTVKAKELLKSKYDWKEYGSKHEESIFTRFYQNYILPRKFNIDKRKVHLSALIRNQKITRDEALEVLKDQTEDTNLTQKDKDFVLKKLGFTSEEFDKMMISEPVPHSNYKNYSFYNDLYMKVYKYLFR